VLLRGKFIGGHMWDGRFHGLTGVDAFVNPNEQANVATPDTQVFRAGYSVLLATKIPNRPYAGLFKTVFGADAFTGTSVNYQNRTISRNELIYIQVMQALQAFLVSTKTNPFSSKFDAQLVGEYTFAADEQLGHDLFFGRAQCSKCHSSTTLDQSILPAIARGRELFTMFCYANTGAPKNVYNPFYNQTDATTDPLGYNPLGKKFIDLGLGANPFKSSDPVPIAFFNATPGDIVQYRGLFKVPTLRNVNVRPYQTFHKALLHNGSIHYIQNVVQRYNQRNLAVNASGQQISFDLRTGPPAGYVALLPSPEVLDNVINVAGLAPSDPKVDPNDTSKNGQIGNLQLSSTEEAAIVSFLQTLDDGYFLP
jgi:cytochrome c peroxidase